MVVVVQVQSWIHAALLASLPGQPGQFGHSGNEQFSVRQMGAKGSRSGSLQYCITCWDWPTLCLVFSVLYRWWAFVPYRISAKGWRMMSLRFQAVR